MGSRRKGRHWLYGVNPVKEALRSGRTVWGVYLYRERTDRTAEEITALATRRGIDPVPVDRAFFSGFPKGHQGVAARVGPARRYSLDDLLALSSRSGEQPFYLVIDGVEDPGNLGAIIRTAEAGGVQGLILQKRRVASGATVAKASAGAVEYLPVIGVPNIKQAIRALKERGVTVYGAEAGAEAPYWSADLTVPLAIVLGSEGRGIRRTVRECCDGLIEIPVLGRVGSLNVSVAAGVIIYEVLRQRRGAGRGEDAP